MVEVISTAEEVKDEEDPPSKFGPYSDTNKSYTFEDEVKCLLYKFNIDGALFTKEQHDHLLNLIYDNQHDEDLGFCDKLTHTILTVTDVFAS